MTNQEIFDRAWEHFVINGKPLGYDCGIRTYRNPPCAIGICIPEEVYSKDMETLDVEDIAHNYSLGHLFPDVSFACRMQACHDDCVVSEGEINTALVDFAMCEGLEVPA